MFHARHTLGWLGGSLILASMALAQGPDDKGAVLRDPFAAPRSATPAPVAAVPPAAAPARSPEYLKNFLPELQPHDGERVPRRNLAALEEKPDINQDIQITPAAGAWMIFLISYSGDDGPAEARKMVSEVRSTYRLPAYVFYYGAEDRRKENERVRKLLQEQSEFYRKNNLAPPDDGLTIRHRSIDVQYAVLIGGAPDADAAKAILARVRKFDAPNPKTVQMESRFSGEETKDGKITNGYAHYINPFHRAFICRNPSVVKQEAAPAKDEPTDLPSLKRMNANESFSLLACPRRLTLAVKEFRTPFMMQDRNAAPGLWDSLMSKSDGADKTALDAHNLADTLRKLRLEAYVLHTKFSSVVSVGGFDGPDDPALKSMQELLAARFNQGPYTQIQFFYRPVPMAIPR